MRRLLLSLLIALLPLPALAGDGRDVMLTWYKLVLELVRHTPTYSPPVASRAFAYLGVTSYEVMASGRPEMQSLAGQLTDLAPLPAPAGVVDEGVVMHAALAQSVRAFFGNTGPSGQQAMDRMDDALRAAVVAGLPDAVVARSAAHGRAIAGAIWLWSEADGGAVVQNMGFPREHSVSTKPGAWVPTSRIVQQQAPLLPDWGRNRTFAMPAGTTCGLPPPMDYSEESGSAFMLQAREVHDITARLTDEQKTIARFWADDPMLSPTPPGHWISIALTLIAAENLNGPQAADILARVGVSLADSFIGCWATKFQYDTVRPVTVIKALIDPTWEPLLITPPFPEYPSGHSTQSGAAAAVLTAIFGAAHAFDDPTHEDDGMPTRHYPSFRAAAEEAAMSRLYGGIHFRAAIEQGLAQGECIGAYSVALRTLE